MHPPPARQRQPKPKPKPRWRRLLRPKAITIALGATGMLLVAGFGAGLKANEVQVVRRSGSVGRYAPIAVDSLPLYRPAVRLRPAAIPRTQPPQAAPAAHREGLPVAAGHTSVIKGKLARGQSLSGLLRARGVSAQMLRTIDRRIRPEFDFRGAQPGQSFQLTRDARGELLLFRYHTTPDESIVLSRSANGYSVTRERSPLEPRLTRMHGTVESSLYKSIRVMGHDPGLANAFAEIFAWDIDFSRQLKTGDDFTILYERLYRDEDGTEVYVRPGRILAAQFRGSAGEHTAVYFEENDGVGSYFRPDGDTLEQEFLVAPLKFSRISSSYSTARNHPILKVVRPHHGIDYAARTGTPLWSVADGTVIFRGVNGGFGNLVKIRHANGYVSYYAHLSAFTPGLEVGQSVKQKQVIGNVGQTGLATGPHVCFRVTKYGKYVNPASLNRSKPVLRSVADASWADFEIVRDQLLVGLRDAGSSEFAGNAL